MQDFFGKLVRGVTYVAATAILVLVAAAAILFLLSLIGKILAW